MLLTMVRVKWYFPHVKLADPRTVEYNQPVWHWSKETAKALPVSRQDSANPQDYGSYTSQTPDSAPPQFRNLLGAIRGTPQTGWYDLLDSS
jgi:hypothetical protein